MPGLWINNPKTPEGKYGVFRRNGTMPDWPHFVLGARDPYAEQALLAYADAAEAGGADPEFVTDVREHAHEFFVYRTLHGNGDPTAAPEIEDDPRVIEIMQRGSLFADHE
jgi:hypothetical protein